jgi:hypothetical protein
MTKIEITTDKDLGIKKALATLELPPVTVERYAADVDDLKYALQRAYSEIIEQIIEYQFPNNV